MIYKKKAPAIFFLFPAFFFLAVFLYYPFVLNFIDSFKDIPGPGSEAIGNIGITNYYNMFHDQYIMYSLKNTAILMVGAILFQVGIALVLAILVDNISKGAQIYRTVFFFPIVVSGTALGMMFSLLFKYNPLRADDNGLFNQIIMALGMKQIDWFDERWAIYTILVPIIWQYVGFYFVIILTGLNNISNDIYESASIDGATGFKKIWYITLPLIYNVLCTCLTLAITGALKVFDLPWTIRAQGAPSGTTYFTGTYMYNVTFITGNADYGAAIAMMIVVIGVVISQLANILFKPKDY